MLFLAQTCGAITGKAMHLHPEGQLYVATQGVMVVETDQGRYIMPPGRMGWVPPLVPHGAMVMSNGKADDPEAVVGYSMYLQPALCSALPAEMAVLGMTGLAKAIFGRMAQWTTGAPLDEAQRRLLDVLLDEIVAAPQEKLRLTMPHDRRLAILAGTIANDPADQSSLEDWEQRLSMSRRTITRQFRAQTGMSVVEWRQVARLQRALELLGAGTPVTAVAIDLGYDSVSSFIALFRRALGVTPARYAAGPGLAFAL